MPMPPAFLSPLPFSPRPHNIISSRTPRPIIPRYTPPQARVRRGPKPDPEIPDSLYTADPIPDAHAKPFDFSTLTDKVVLVCNVASNDTHTEANYTLFAKLIESYHAGGLEIVAFPSNWYGQKETGSTEDIKKFVHSKYSDKIHVMNKTDLEWNQVFALGCRYFPGEIIWNFHGKFLFNRQGIPVERFDLLTTDEYIEDQVRAQISGGYSSPANPEENSMDLAEDFSSV